MVVVSILLIFRVAKKINWHIAFLNTLENIQRKCESIIRDCFSLEKTTRQIERIPYDWKIFENRSIRYIISSRVNISIVEISRKRICNYTVRYILFIKFGNENAP